MEGVYKLIDTPIWQPIALKQTLGVNVITTKTIVCVVMDQENAVVAARLMQIASNQVCKTSSPYVATEFVEQLSATIMDHAILIVTASEMKSVPNAAIRSAQTLLMT